MTPVKAFEGDQGRLFSTEKDAIMSLLAGPSGVACDAFRAAVWGTAKGRPLDDQAKRIRAAIVAAAKQIQKLK